jgi:hypothetical protein
MSPLWISKFTNMGRPFSPSSSSSDTTVYEPVSSEEALLGDSEKHLPESVFRRRASTNWTTVHITLIFIYTVIFGLAFVRFHQSYSHGTNLIYSEHPV